MKIGNGKKMSEIEKELIEFLPEAEAKSFTEGLTNELLQYSIKKSPIPINKVKKIQSVVQKVPTTSTVEVVKQGSATLIKQPQNTRLLTTAIKSSSINQAGVVANSSTSVDLKKRKSIDSAGPSPVTTESRVVSLDTDRGMHTLLSLFSCLFSFY